MSKKSLAILATTIFSSTLIAGAILAFNNANIDKLHLLNRAVANNSVKDLQRTRPDIKVKTGSRHSGAIIDNKLYMWGANDFGQLGLGSDTQTYKSPTQVTSITGAITDLSLGNNHSGAIINSKVYMWGANFSGQLGLEGDQKRLSPELVNIPTTASISHLSLGYDHTGAVADDKLYMWGSNYNGELGLGDNVNHNKPELVGGITGTITNLSLGAVFSGAVANNKLYMWGANDSGQLGINSIQAQNKPVQVSGLNGEITHLELGKTHSGAVIGNKLYMWGDNIFGQLGLDNNASTRIPTEVKSISGNITDLSLGFEHSGAVVNNKLYMWGKNVDGQLGFDDTKPYTSPTEVTRISGNIVNLALGESQSAVVVDNQLYMWGNNRNAQLGLGNNITSYIPAEVKNFPGLDTYVSINLNTTNDQNNTRSKNAFNVTDNEILSLVQQSRTEIGLIYDDAFTVANTVKIGKSLKTNKGEIKTYVTTDRGKKFVTTFIGFIPVNETQNVIITQKTIPVNDNTFKYFEINSLVNQANKDSTGIKNQLSKWIIANKTLFLGDVSTDNENFPKNTNIVKANNFKVDSGLNGTISFDLYVDKYYKIAGGNLIISTVNNVPIKLVNKVSLSGFENVNESTIYINTSSNHNLSPDQLLKLFGNPNGTTPIKGDNLNELIKYFYGFDTFPPSTQFIIKDINNISEENVGSKAALEFRIQANQYYDGNGQLQKKVKVYPSTSTKFKIDNLLNPVSEPKLQNEYNQLPASDILTYLSYNSPIGSVDNSKLKEYFNLDTFPKNTTFSLNNVKDNSSSLSVSITANTWFDLNGNKQITSKTYDAITIGDLPLTKTTTIEHKNTYDKNISSKDLANSFKHNSTSGNFDINAVKNYVKFITLVPTASYTMKNLSVNETDLTFTIVASQAYVNNQTSNNKEFNIKINDLLVKPDSITKSIVHENIEIDGTELSDQIFANITPGSVINTYSPDYELWTQIIDVESYPPSTDFTIIEVNKIDKNIFTNFSIKVNASSYYEANTTVNKNQQRIVEINNLKFAPTIIAVKEKLPTHVNANNFLTYIEYDANDGTFNASKLQEFVTLNGVDLSAPGTSIKIINVQENTNKNTVNFQLQVPHYVNENGIGVNQAKIIDLNLDLNPISDNMGMIIGISVGVGSAVIIAIIIIAVIFTKKKKAKLLDNQTTTISK